MTAIATTMLFTGCINDDLEEGDPQQIRFSTRVAGIVSTDIGGDGTRAVYNEDTFSQFKVTAFDNSKPYFENVEATYQDDNTWKTNVGYYWPQYSLNFYGYAPLSLQDKVYITADVHQIKDYTVKTKVAEQDDVLSSFNNANSGTENGVVPLYFQHAMHQIEIKAKNGSPIDPENTDPDKAQYKVEVLGVKLCQVPSTATLTFQTTPDGVPTWSEPTGLADYMIKGTEPIVLTDKLTSLNFGTDGFLMMPQQLTAWSGSETNNDGAYVAVLCRITDKDGNKIYPKNSDNYAFVAMPIKENWEVNKRHSVTLMFFTNGGGAGIVPPDLTNPELADDPNVDTNPGMNEGDRVIPEASTAMVVSEKISNWEQAADTEIYF